MGRLVRAAAWASVVVVAAVITISVVVPRVGGGTPYSVLTGSMRPSMPPGTLVVVRPVAPDHVRVGDVVTYQLRSGEPTVVTHRVVTVGVNDQGERVFRTKGDANDVADQGWVRAVQLKGVRWYDAPYLGRATNLLTGTQRQLVLHVTITLLLLYAAAMLASAARDRRRTEVVLHG